MPEHLIAGLRRFRQQRFPRYQEHFERLVADGQRPGTLFIGCSDSRLVPDLLTGAGPGELFSVRNVGNLVPAFEAGTAGPGTAAAVEYAVLVLGVTDIVVCGHTHCGAIRGLYEPPDPAATPHLARWLELAREARLDAAASEPVLRRTERRSIALQVSRLLEYPTVVERLEAGRLSVHGWHYAIEEGTVARLDVERGEFVPALAG